MVALPPMPRGWPHYVGNALKLIGAAALVGVVVVGMVIILNEIIARFP
jgi:hypothetical protein